MLPTALTFSNYRSFAGPQRLELRPLTLLYGENNTGKSALIRSLPLLADGAATDGLDALDLRARLANFELDFDSLRWKGRAETDEHTVGIELEWEEDPILRQAHIALWEHPEWSRLLVERLLLVDGEDVSHEFNHSLQRSERRSNNLSYRYRSAGMDEPLTLSFSGLTPHTVGTQAPIIAALAERLREFVGQVVWLRSLRPPPPRILRHRGTVSWTLDPLGADAPFLLHEERALQREVSRWYADQLELELIVERPVGRDLRVALRKTKRAGFDVDLVDTGEGLSQVLPVLTALAMAKMRAEHGGSPGIVAVEEPEAHLHPTLQQGLATYVCEVAASSGARVVLETHARQFLLAVQRAILAGIISARDVIVYWVRQLDDGRSIAEPVELTALARLRGRWPSDAFEAEFELAADIQDLRDAKEAR